MRHPPRGVFAPTPDPTASTDVREGLATHCPSCGFENPEGLKFCNECGAPLRMRCPQCEFANQPQAKFCGECGTALPPQASTAPPLAPRPHAPLSYTPAHLAEKILQSKAALEGERKQVTVLFVDVSGFTTLAERLDPEDVHQLMDRAFELMLGEVHRYEGTVNQFLGDGIMALFGSPIAHEDHPVRAVLAALGIQRALATYRDQLKADHGIDFQVRMGLNTGAVVESIAPHRANRKAPKTQDGRPLRRYKRRWKVERLFAWLQTAGACWCATNTMSRTSFGLAV